MKFLANILFVSSLILGLQTARLRWKASYQRRAEQQELRQWYDTKWRRISASPWVRLPEVVIAWLLQARDSLARLNLWRIFQPITFVALPVAVISVLWTRANQSHVVRFASELHAVAIIIAALLLYGASVISAKLNRRWLCIASISIFSGLGTFVCFSYGLDHNHRNAIIFTVISAWLPVVLIERLGAYRRIKLSKDIPATTKIILVLDLVIVTVLLVYTQKVWLDILATASIGWAVIDAAVFLPFMGMVMSFVPTWLIGWVMAAKRQMGTAKEEMDPDVERVTSTVLLFGSSVALSFMVTLGSLLIGHRFEPYVWLPQTQRMLWSNALFDGLTLISSIALLECTIPPRRLLSIPAAVGMNILLGIIFACASLWFGVKRLTVIEVARVLVAHSTNGRCWEVGPYFWAMHTVFLPLLFYLLVVLVCWVGKAIVEYRKWFYETAKDEEINGLSMTTAFLGAVAVVLGAAAALVRWIA